MYSLYMENDEILIKDLEEKDLFSVYKWYNDIEEFRYAMGNDKPIEPRELARKYMKAVMSEKEFFVGIHSKKEKRIIGTIKGRLYNMREGINGGTVWISLIAIDPACRNMGYGSLSLTLLLNYLRTKTVFKRIYLAVDEENVMGLKFWISNGFREVKRLCGGKDDVNRNRGVIIMFLPLTDS